MSAKGTYKWFKNQRMQKKLFIVYVPVIIIPLILLGLLSTYFLNQALVKKAMVMVQDSSKLIVSQINNLLDSVENCSNIIIGDINNLLQNYNSSTTNTNSPLNQLELQKKILFQLNYRAVSFPYIDSVIFIDTTSNVYTTSNKLLPFKESILKSEIIQFIDSQNSKSIWFPIEQRDYLVTDADEPVLTLGKKVVEIETQSTLGYLILNINENKLTDYYAGTNESRNDVHYLINSDGIIVSTDNKERLMESVHDEVFQQLHKEWDGTGQVTEFENTKSLVTITPIQNMNWFLINETPLSELTLGNEQITAAIVMISLICIIIVMFVARKISTLISTPIMQLSVDMLKVQKGNLNITSKIDSQDEVGILAAGFNKMINRIKDLLGAVQEEQTKKREYELALIQSQIKPHFLYNTLDVIYVLSRMGKAQEAASTTKSLADFYRIALSKGAEMISLEEEIKNVTSYLEIQSTRYKDIFTYEINIPKELYSVEILKLTIQPIVENSIYHGLKTKGSMGTIIITASSEQDQVLISVLDNGIGIPDSKIKELKSPATPFVHPSQHFGLRSVDERLKLRFGEKYGIQINSILNKGTEIVITLPRSREEGDKVHE